MVEETGPGAHKFQPGQRVVALPWPTWSDPKLDPAKAAGTYQQYLAASEDVLVQPMSQHHSGLFTITTDLRSCLSCKGTAIVAVCATPQRQPVAAQYAVPDEVHDVTAAQFAVSQRRHSAWLSRHAPCVPCSCGDDTS